VRFIHKVCFERNKLYKDIIEKFKMDNLDELNLENDKNIQKNLDKDGKELNSV
jgi:hypothetical protein